MSNEEQKWTEGWRYVVNVPTFDGRSLHEFTIVELGTNIAKLSRANKDECWFMLDTMNAWTIVEAFKPKRSTLLDAAMCEFWTKDIKQ